MSTLKVTILAAGSAAALLAGGTLAFAQMGPSSQPEPSVDQAPIYAAPAAGWNRGVAAPLGPSAQVEPAPQWGGYPAHSKPVKLKTHQAR